MKYTSIQQSINNKNEKGYNGKTLKKPLNQKLDPYELTKQLDL